tara:strand:+ start:24542 stop:24742 length:201 start_codon:yes stop_codon:yes gene_type:complete
METITIVQYWMMLHLGVGAGIIMVNWAMVQPPTVTLPLLWIWELAEVRFLYQQETTLPARFLIMGK